MKEAEDIAFEKEMEYTRGAVDVLEMIRADINEVMKVPEMDRFDALTDAIEHIYCESVEKHTENVKTNFIHFFKAELWIRDHKQEQSEAGPLCPNGCGTRLEKRKFVDVFSEKMEPSQQDVEENLFCPKCHIRWILEPHSDLLNSPNPDQAEKAKEKQTEATAQPKSSEPELQVAAEA